MRITSEADYAIRICTVLCEEGKLGTCEISEKACVSQRFALKILRKLAGEDIVRSYKGACGGYELAKLPSDIRALDIIEAIDGRVFINKCLDCSEDCTKNQNKSDCRMHLAFAAINKNVRDSLSNITLDVLVDKNVTPQNIVELVNNA